MRPPISGHEYSRSIHALPRPPISTRVSGGFPYAFSRQATSGSMPILMTLAACSILSPTGKGHLRIQLTEHPPPKLRQRPSRNSLNRWAITKKCNIAVGLPFLLTIHRPNKPHALDTEASCQTLHRSEVAPVVGTRYETEPANPETCPGPPSKQARAVRAPSFGECGQGTGACEFLKCDREFDVADQSRLG